MGSNKGNKHARTSLGVVFQFIGEDLKPSEGEKKRETNQNLVYYVLSNRFISEHDIIIWSGDSSELVESDDLPEMAVPDDLPEAAAEPDDAPEAVEPDELSGLMADYHQLRERTEFNSSKRSWLTKNVMQALPEPNEASGRKEYLNLEFKSGEELQASVRLVFSLVSVTHRNDKKDSGKKRERPLADAPESEDAPAVRQTSSVSEWMVLRYAGEASEAMAEALAHYGIDPRPYRNETNLLRHAEFPDEDMRARLLLTLFLATGFWPDDPSKVWDEVQGHAKDLKAIDGKVLNAPKQPAPTNDREECLTKPVPGLYRLHPEGNYETFYPLDPKGTTIGLVPDPDAACSITDVEPPYVSPWHLSIWQDSDDGPWSCWGLDSTNGTVLERPRDGGKPERIVVERPHDEYEGDLDRDEIQLMDGDVLVLAQNTRFRVVNVSRATEPEPAPGEKGEGESVSEETGEGE